MMNGRIIGIKPITNEGCCFKCGKRGSHIAYYGHGDGMLHSENFCNSCIDAAVDLYALDSAHKFKEQRRRMYEESVTTDN
jgi:hypothetical protein